MRTWKSKSFKRKPLVSLVAASFVLDDPRRVEAQLSLVYCLRAQTYANWQLVVVHDGPDQGRLDPVRRIDDTRIRVVEAPQRKKEFGHPWRWWAANKCTNGEFIGFTNEDNWYAPVYLEAMMFELASQRGDFAYCNMVHSHQGWKPTDTRPVRGRIDLGGWIAARHLVIGTPWTNHSFAGDWFFVRDLYAKAKHVRKVREYLFVHN